MKNKLGMLRDSIGSVTPCGKPQQHVYPFDNDCLVMRRRRCAQRSNEQEESSVGTIDFDPLHAWHSLLHHGPSSTTMTSTE
jgi:hypothetical protein